MVPEPITILGCMFGPAYDLTTLACGGTVSARPGRGWLSRSRSRVSQLITKADHAPKACEPEREVAALWVAEAPAGDGGALPPNGEAPAVSCAEAIASEPSTPPPGGGDREAPTPLARVRTQPNRRILVSSNCQAGGIAAALRTIFPEDDVAAMPMPDPQDNDAIAHLAQQLAFSDIWVSHVDHGYLLNVPEVAANVVGKQIVKIPHISFDAFHPDLCYVRQASCGEIVVPHYNSRIIVWAYRNGIDPNDVAGLFDEDVFDKLGYFNRWDESVRHLRWIFEMCELDFSRFFLRIKRLGNFMYSTNHPRAQVIVDLAKLVSLQMGAPESIIDVEIDIVDALAHLDIWPVYPQIGDRLGVASSFRWKRNNLMYNASEFIDNSYNEFHLQGIAPDDLKIVESFIDDLTLDRVLGERIEQDR